jgi:hypothetical protein
VSYRVVNVTIATACCFVTLLGLRMLILFGLATSTFLINVGMIINLDVMADFFISMY